jgi:hypothetical protein
VAVKECCTSEIMTNQMKYTIQLLTAMYLQATGQFELAKIEYQSLLEVYPPETEWSPYPPHCRIFTTFVSI